MKNGKKIYLLTLGALFIALIFVSTAFLAIPMPVVGGYIHPGDVFVCLAGAFLPLPLAAFCGAAGGALADLQAGFALYMPATFLIKGVMAAVMCRFRGTKLIGWRQMLGVLLSACVCIGGYFLYDCILYGAGAAVVSAGFNAIQCAATLILYLIFGFALDIGGLYRRLYRR